MAGNDTNVRRIKALEFELEAKSTTIGRLSSENQKLSETASYFAWKAGCHEDEYIQHGIKMLDHTDSFDGMRNWLMRGDNDQASTAKYRQLKIHFQKYQAAINQVLEEIEELGRLNVMTTEHVRRFSSRARQLISIARRG